MGYMTSEERDQYILASENIDWSHHTKSQFGCRRTFSTYLFVDSQNLLLSLLRHIRFNFEMKMVTQIKKKVDIYRKLVLDIDLLMQTV